MSKTLTQLQFDVDWLEGEESNFSVEYIKDGKANKLTLFLPFAVVQLTTRWE